MNHDRPAGAGHDEMNLHAQSLKRSEVIVSFVIFQP